MLFTAHLFFAKASKMDVWELTSEESEQLANAITRVTQLYDISILDEKKLAFINLAMVLGNVYGTRLMAVAIDKKKKQPVDMPFEIKQDVPNQYVNGGMI